MLPHADYQPSYFRLDAPQRDCGEKKSSPRIGSTGKSATHCSFTRTLRRLSYLRSHAHLWRATQLSRAGLGAEELASQQQPLDCADEVARSLRFENISLGLGLADLGGKSVGFVHREHQNAWSRVETRDESCGLQSAHHRHSDVEDDDVGAKPFDGLDRILAVRGLSRDLPFRSRAANQSPDSLSNDFMIVNNQNPGSHSSTHVFSRIYFCNRCCILTWL